MVLAEWRHDCSVEPTCRRTFDCRLSELDVVRYAGDLKTAKTAKAASRLPSHSRG